MAIDTFPVKLLPPFSALGFDYGTSRIGVAFGQSLTGTAQALSILPATDGIPDWNQVAGLISSWQPQVLIVGLPYNMDGSISELMVRAEKFANRLNGRFHLPCYGIDERLSSVAAEELVAGKKNVALDSIAAQLILESWFAELKKRQGAIP